MSLLIGLLFQHTKNKETVFFGGEVYSLDRRALDVWSVTENNEVVHQRRMCYQTETVPTKLTIDAHTEYCTYMLLRMYTVKVHKKSTGCS